MEYWGFRRINGFPVETFYLIKGGGHPEFWRYNRGSTTSPPRGLSYPPWERLAAFNIIPDSAFYPGADLALKFNNWDSIYAIRGNGEEFGIYSISANRWYSRDNLLEDGAFIGGALASHPEWVDIPGEDDKDSVPIELLYSILHCLRGGNSNNFDDYDDLPHDQWYGCGTVPHSVTSGSDMEYGKVYITNSTDPDRFGIWVIAGNNDNAVRFFSKRSLPNGNFGGGGQTIGSFTDQNQAISISPNPAHSTVTLKVQKSSSDVKIYSKNGVIIRRLKLSNGNTVWDLKDAEGNSVSSGVYFFGIQSGNKEIRSKLVINK